MNMLITANVRRDIEGILSGNPHVVVCVPYAGLVRVEVFHECAWNDVADALKNAGLKCVSLDKCVSFEEFCVGKFYASNGVMVVMRSW